MTQVVVLVNLHANTAQQQEITELHVVVHLTDLGQPQSHAHADQGTMIIQLHVLLVIHFVERVLHLEALHA